MTTTIERVGPREILVIGDVSWVKAGMRVTSQWQAGYSRGGHTTVTAVEPRENGRTLVSVVSTHSISAIHQGDLLVPYRDETDVMRDELADLKRRVEALEAKP